MREKLKSLLITQFPVIEEPMPGGDMPGDSIIYSQDSVNKGAILFRELLERIDLDTRDKWIISISGGSGSGKTTLASILAFYFEKANIGTYILSGDNYPRRIPKYNDAERLHLYRDAGQNALIEQFLYTEEVKIVLEKIYTEQKDGSLYYLTQYPWYSTYHIAGKDALANYVGTNNELNFDAINRVLKDFKEGKKKIWLKRLGRNPEALWYDEVDFSKNKIIFVEWTHGNHQQLEHVDIRLFLNSTPSETLSYRQLRARDGQADSDFVKMVLEIEQVKLHQQARHAKLIFSKNGKVLDYNTYVNLIERE